MGCCAKKLHCNIKCNCSKKCPFILCFWFRAEKPRNIFFAMLSGIFFFSGWWVIFDAALNYKDDIPPAYYTIGVAGTFSFIMVNIVRASHITGNGFSSGGFTVVLARFWLFIGFVIAFGCLVAATWILFVEYVPSGKNTEAGVEIFVQNYLIFISSLLYKFGIVEDETF